MSDQSSEPTGRKQLLLSDLITEEEFKALRTHILLLKKQSLGSPKNNIIDWVAKHPELMNRLTEHGVLITYFAYLLIAHVPEFQ
jgi:hypothetical protein